MGVQRGYVTYSRSHERTENPAYAAWLQHLKLSLLKYNLHLSGAAGKFHEVISAEALVSAL